VLYRDEQGNWGRLSAVRLPPHQLTGHCTRRVLGSRKAERLRGTSGSELIRAGAGRDRI
jgi:hypothetical protein